MRKYSIWLAGVILLTIVAFLIVFKPITMTPRKDPIDASKYLAPVGVKGMRDRSIPPTKPTFNFFKSPVYVYVPQHDLDLGLDLRGGLSVVLQISNRADFKYPLHSTIAEGDIAAKKEAFTNAVEAAFDPAEYKEMIVELTGTEASVSSSPTDRTQAEVQLQKLTKVMTQIFGAGSFDEPKIATAFVPVNKTVQENVRAILERRVNPEGTREISSYSKGNNNQVVLEIPGEHDPQKVLEILGKTGKLDFRILARDITVTDDNNGKPLFSRGYSTITTAEALKSATLAVEGSELDPTSSVVVYNGKPVVTFSMKSDESRVKFGNITNANVNRYMAIVLDNETIYSAPVIKSRISGSGQIEGNFTQDEAKSLATILNAGALPAKTTVVETRIVSATLGADSIALSLKAGIIGLLAVLIFMVAYYRLPGLMADLALVVYLILSLAVIKLFQSTLTLPGIAGIIIAIGMAVDANVIIFERLKEELRTQKPLESAIDVAFARAWTAILDSNVASLITGFVLYSIGTGAVKGFAVTLLIGVAVSMFTAVTVTRLFMKIMMRSKAGHNMAWYGV